MQTYFSQPVMKEIIRYAELWEDQMPATGISFRIQCIQRKYRTVIIGYKTRSDIVCTTAHDIIDFSPLADTPDAGWSSSLADKYAFMLRNQLTWTTSEDVMNQVFALLQDKTKYSEVDENAFFELLKKGKLSLNDKLKRNQHPKLVYNAIKNRNRITQNGDKVSLFIRNRKTTEDAALDIELGETE